MTHNISRLPLLEDSDEMKVMHFCVQEENME